MITKIIMFLIDGCFHHWRIVKTFNILVPDTQKIMGEKLIYKCIHCNKARVKDLMYN